MKLKKENNRNGEIKMKISYHGHSVVKIQTKQHTIIIDPFITGNELTDLVADEVKVDAILLTHGHDDHVGDTVALAKKNDALVVAPFELANYLGAKGVKVHAMGIGGEYDFEFGRVKLTQAFHSSSTTREDGTSIYLGMPTGIIFTAEDVTIYHAGDTGLFGDMKLIGERNDIDIAFLPIGSNFTMGPEDAAYAAELIKPKIVVPIHFNTFPPIKQDPQHFKNLVKGVQVQVLSPGEYVQLELH